MIIFTYDYLLPCSCCACMAQHGNKTVYQSPTRCLCIDIWVDFCSNPLFYERRGKGDDLRRSTHMLSLLKMMVDAMHRSPYTVYDSKSNMDYR